MEAIFVLIKVFILNGIDSFPRHMNSPMSMKDISPALTFEYFCRASIRQMQK